MKTIICEANVSEIVKARRLLATMKFKARLREVFIEYGRGKEVEEYEREQAKKLGQSSAGAWLGQP